MFRKILIAVDDSEPGQYAAQRGVDLATQLGAEVALLTVLPPPPAVVADVKATGQMLDARWEAAHRLLRRFHDRLPQGTKVDEMVSEGSPPEEIVLTATNWHADAVIVGTHSRQGLSRLLLGSTAEAVIRRAPCTVLVMRRPPEQAVEDVAGLVREAEVETR